LTTSIRVEIVIDLSPEQLWAVVEPIETHAEWMHDAEAITFTSERRRGVGTTFDAATKVGPFRLTDRMEVTQWEPEAVMGVRHVGLVSGVGRFTLEPTGPAATRFTWEEQLTFPWWLGWRLGEVIGRPILRAIWRRNLRNLKAIAEA